MTVMMTPERNQLNRLAGDVLAVTLFLVELEVNTENGVLNEANRTSLFHELELLADTYFGADDEPEEDKVEGLERLFVFFESPSGYDVSTQDQRMQSIVRLTRLYVSLTKQLGFGYVNYMLANFQNYWETVSASFLVTSKMQTVRAILCENMLTALAEDAQSLSDEELDEYMAVPAEWRMKMLGFLGTDDARFNPNQIIETTLGALKDVHGRIKLLYHDINDLNDVIVRRRDLPKNLLSSKQ